MSSTYFIEFWIWSISGNPALLYQIEQRRANLGRISCAWSMNMDFMSVLHQVKPLYPENDSMTSRSSSPASADSQNDDNYVEEVWEELEATFRAQEANFMAEEYAVEDVPLDGLGLMSDSLGTPKTQTPTSLILPYQPRPAAPDFGSESPTPSIPSSSRLPLYSLPPVWPPNPDLQSEYCVSPSCSQAAFPSKQAQVEGYSAPIEITRASPTGRFLACEDQIRALVNREAWVHGAVINTLGDLFCYSSRSQCRAQRYEILPTWLFDWWKNPPKDQPATEDCRRSYSASFKEVASPVESHAWLVPALLNDHWYLLALDWMECQVCIYDSLARCDEPPPSELTKFATTLVAYVHEDFDLGHQEWLIIPERVRSLT